MNGTRHLHQKPFSGISHASSAIITLLQKGGRVFHSTFHYRKTLVERLRTPVGCLIQILNLAA